MSNSRENSSPIASLESSIDSQSKDHSYGYQEIPKVINLDEIQYLITESRKLLTNALKTTDSKRNEIIAITNEKLLCIKRRIGNINEQLQNFEEVQNRNRENYMQKIKDKFEKEMEDGHLMYKSEINELKNELKNYKKKYEISEEAWRNKLQSLKQEVEVNLIY